MILCAHLSEIRQGQATSSGQWFVVYINSELKHFNCWWKILQLFFFLWLCWETWGSSVPEYSSKIDSRIFNNLGPWVTSLYAWDRGMNNKEKFVNCLLQHKPNLTNITLLSWDWSINHKPGCSQLYSSCLSKLWVSSASMKKPEQPKRWNFKVESIDTTAHCFFLSSF